MSEPKPQRKSRAKQEPKTSPTDAVSAYSANEQRENNSQQQPSSQTPPDSGSADPVSIDSNQGMNNQKEDSREENNQQTPLADKPDQKQTTGGVPSTSVEAETLDSDIPPAILVALAREGEGRAACWERLRKEARAAGMARGQGPGTAYEWATRETDRLFPAPLPPEPPPPPEPEPVIPDVPPPEPEPEEPEAAIAADKPAADSLVFAVPESWGELPDNATLQAEIAWVSANRLRVRDGSGVDLSRAKTPAPSYSALSWLETSILFPSKFADISVKATANQDDERELIRREKASIEEIRSILSEMLED